MSANTAASGRSSSSAGCLQAARASRSKNSSKDAGDTSVGDDGGKALVRVKPMGAGGGGGEASTTGVASNPKLAVSFAEQEVTVDSKVFTYPRRVFGPDIGQQALYEQFMPVRIAGFLDSYNVNIMAYGQTGSGKTHTVFGPPGFMARAASGEIGLDIVEEYGLFPRALFEIFYKVQRRRASSSDTSFVLTASAVELSMLGNIDMMVKSEPQDGRGGKTNTKWNSPDANGVALDKAALPPRLYGMVELPLDEPDDLLRVFGAIASRNTSGTQMNDSSSRSHCFVFLTLFVHNKNTDELRTSRFQFVDLAGSERLQDAHGTTNWKDGGMIGTNDIVVGMLTNYSLTMLSTCVRDLVAARRSNKKFSFRAYLFDLVLLLQESMTGSAYTAIIICLSQAPDNLAQTKFALDFGEVFSHLPSAQQERQPVVARATFTKKVDKLLNESEAALRRGVQGKFTVVRQAQVRDCQQLMAVMSRFD